MFSAMSVTKTLRLTTAAIAWAAVLVQLVFSIRNGVARGESFARALADYLAYFTILTNLLVAPRRPTPQQTLSATSGPLCALPHMPRLHSRRRTPSARDDLALTRCLLSESRPW